jgi:hypothetical protein
VQIYENALSVDLCEEMYDFAIDTISGKNYGIKEKQTYFWTNYAWKESLVLDSTPVICIHLTDQLKDRLTKEIKELGIYDEVTDFSLHDQSYAMVFVWGRDSYIGEHQDGTTRKTFTVYLNKEWDISEGGLFHWFDNNSNEWKTFIPKFNSLVYNDGEPRHYTTPVKSKNKFRVTLQVFINKKDAVTLYQEKKLKKQQQ